MSLDVYLTLPEPSVRPEGIFVRRDGAAAQVSREEWDEMYPGREPVVLPADPSDSTEVYTGNITHNLGKMASECGLYAPLWEAQDNGVKHARELIEPLRAGLARLIAERERLLEFNPANGWGNYDLLVSFTQDYLEACEEWPDADVDVSR